MIVERKYRRNEVGTRSQKAKIIVTRLEESRFEALNSLEVISVKKGKVNLLLWGLSSSKELL